MSGSTTELALKTAVDADDTADYLTLSLADSLRTVDALFNNVTGHSHAGAHQGGPIATVPAGSIPDGSITSAKIADGSIQGTDIADGAITSAKIADGTITSADIADGTISATDLAVGAASNNVFGVWAIGGSTTATSYGVIPSTNVLNMTTVGGFVFMFGAACVFSTAASADMAIGILVDGATWYTVASMREPSGSMPMYLNGFYALGPIAAGAHTFQIGWQTSAGTMSIFTTGGNVQLMAMELRR